MTIVNDILRQMPGLGRPQRKFLATGFVTILVLRGRVNFRNLSRYCDYSERTIARQFREPFDWPAFHQRVLMTALDPGAELVSAHDASFLPKSGKQTCGLHTHAGREEVPAHVQGPCAPWSSPHPLCAELFLCGFVGGFPRRIGHAVEHIPFIIRRLVVP